VRLAYQGEPGAYSEAAALQFGGGDTETLPCKSFDEVFEAVVKKRATHGVVPLENSIGGTIHRNYDLLLEHELSITGEVELDVVHCLQALPGTKLADMGSSSVVTRSSHDLIRAGVHPRWWLSSSRVMGPGACCIVGSFDIRERGGRGHHGAEPWSRFGGEIGAPVICA